MSAETVRVLVIGAHPDDCDLKAGGIACKYTDRGHDVTFVSMTDGTGGHHEQGGAMLARRRRSEAAAAADVANIDYRILDNVDGELRPSLANREAVIRLVREYEPDLVLTHRPNDYHPDHRYTSQLVQDAAYMVTVPNVCPGTPPLSEDPVIAYLHDDFRRPYPFSPDVVVSVDNVVERKFDMLDCHESQVYEWLAYNEGVLDKVPDDPDARREWLRNGGLPHIEALEDIADRFRDELVDRYGEENEGDVRHAEAFEGCEYGRPLTDENIDRLFPFE